MVAVPTFFEVIFPFLFTVATFPLEDVHFTLREILTGFFRKASFSLLPFETPREESESFMDGWIAVVFVYAFIRATALAS